MHKERSHQIQRHIQTESEGMGTGFHASGNQKKPGIDILIADKMGFKAKIEIRIKEKHFIMIKVLIQQEEITCT